MKFLYHLNMSINELRNSVYGKTKIVWVLLKCANYVEDHVEAAQEIGCLWYDYDHILLNYYTFVRFIGKNSVDTTSHYLRSHRFMRDKSKEEIRANVPEKFNFSTFRDQRNWGICKCDGFNKDTTEEEALESKHDENFRSRDNKQNEAFFQSYHQRNNIENQTNFYSFQNRSIAAINRPSYVQQPPPQWQMPQMGYNQFNYNNYNTFHPSQMNNFYLQNSRQSQSCINQAVFPSNFTNFNPQAPQINRLPIPQISSKQTHITSIAPNNQLVNENFYGLNRQNPDEDGNPSNFVNSNQRTQQTNLLPIPQIENRQTSIAPSQSYIQRDAEFLGGLGQQCPGLEEEEGFSFSHHENYFDNPCFPFNDHDESW